MAGITTGAVFFLLIMTTHEVRSTDEGSGSEQNILEPIQDLPQNQTSPQPTEPSKPKDDSVVLITGGNHIDLFQIVEVLDPFSTGCQPTFSPLPAHTMFGHTSHYVAPDNVFLVGGDTSEKGKHCLILKNKGDKLEFQPHNLLHTPRSFHTGVVVDKKIWIFGGVNANSMTESLEGANLEAGWVKETVDAGWNSKCSVAIDNRTLMDTGGEDAYSTPDVRQLDTTTGAWTSLEPMETSRMNHGCVFLPDNRAVLVAGGQKTSQTANDVYLKSSEIYDLETGKWEAVGDLLEARSHGQMVVVGERVFYIGGRGGSKKDLWMKDSIEEYHPDTRSWTKVSNLMLKHGRDVGFSAVVVPGASLGCGVTSGARGIGGGYSTAAVMTFVVMVMTVA